MSNETEGQRTHTPGRWYVDDPGEGTVAMGEGWQVLTDAQMGHFFVAEFYDYEHAEADAHLFAAAKDLLAALQAVVDCGCTFGDCPAHEAARAAIRRATGGGQ